MVDAVSDALHNTHFKPSRELHPTLDEFGTSATYHTGLQQDHMNHDL